MIVAATWINIRETTYNYKPFISVINYSISQQSSNQQYVLPQNQLTLVAEAQTYKIMYTHHHLLDNTRISDDGCFFLSKTKLPQLEFLGIRKIFNKIERN